MYQSLFIHSPSEGHLGHFQNLANMKKTAMSIPVLVFVVVQSPSCVQLFATPWTAAHQASLSLTISQSLPSSFSLHQWCHPAFSSSDALFSFCPQSFPASGSFLMSWLFTPGGQSIGASASASLLPMNIQDWFPLGSTGLISLQSKHLEKHLFLFYWLHQSLWLCGSQQTVESS